MFSSPSLPSLREFGSGFFWAKTVCILINLLWRWALLKSHFGVGEDISFVVLPLGLL